MKVQNAARDAAQEARVLANRSAQEYVSKRMSTLGAHLIQTAVKNAVKRTFASMKGVVTQPYHSGSFGYYRSVEV